jgi:hypothetical protein
LPKQIAVPLYHISKELNMKIGFAVEIAKNWNFKNSINNYYDP